MKFFLLIKVDMPTIVANNCWHLNFNEQEIIAFLAYLSLKLADFLDIFSLPPNAAPDQNLSTCCLLTEFFMEMR